MGQKCLACHDEAYAAFMGEWTTGLDKEVARTTEVLKRAEAAVARARRAGHPRPEASALLKEAREALALVRRARGVHNPAAAEALLEAVRRKAEAALAQEAGKR